MIPVVILHDVEKALGYKLYDWQVEVLCYNDFKNYPKVGERCAGKTTTVILSILLSNVYGPPIRYDDLYKYSDRLEQSYSRQWFKNEVLNIYASLQSVGIRTRILTRH